MRKEIYNGLLNSFDNKKDNGFSGRKLTAFTFTLCGVYANYQVFNLPVISDHLAISVLIVDVVAAAFFIGLVTADQIIKFKSGKGPEVTTAESTAVAEQKQEN
jgi:hypothetical protein